MKFMMSKKKRSGEAMKTNYKGIEVRLIACQTKLFIWRTRTKLYRENKGMVWQPLKIWNNKSKNWIPNHLQVKLSMLKQSSWLIKSKIKSDTLLMRSSNSRRKSKTWRLTTICKRNGYNSKRQPIRNNSKKWAINISRVKHKDKKPLTS